MLKIKSNKLLTWFIIAIVIVAFISGLYGYMAEMNLPIDDAIYKTLILFVLDGDTSDIPVRSIYVNIARFLAPFSLFLGGTQILVYISNDGIKRFRRSLYRNHYVIFGNSLQVKYAVNILRQRMADAGKKHPIVVIGQIDDIVDVDLIDKPIFEPDDFRILNLSYSNRIFALYENEIENLMLVESLCKYLNPQCLDIKSDSRIPSNRVRILMRCNSDETEGLTQEIYRHKFGKFGTFKVVEEAVKSLVPVSNRNIVILGLGEIGREIIHQLCFYNNITGYDTAIQKVDYLNTLYKDNANVNCFVSKMEDLNFHQIGDNSVCYICGGDDALKYRTALRFKLHFPTMDINVLTRFIPSDFSVLEKRDIHVYNYQSLAMESIFSKSSKVVISVIVPAYNAAAYIEDCLRSLSNVCGIGIEFIIVNDGSNDDTLKFIRKYTAKDSRFKLIDTKHIGVGAARNLGVAHAGGDYISFVDADDMISSEMYEVLYHNAIESDADITVCRATSIDSNGEIGRPLECWNFKPGIYDKSQIKNCDFLNNICSPVLWDKLIRREIVIKCLSPSLRRGQDFIALISMIHEANIVRIIDIPLYYYRHHIGSTMAEPLSESTILSDFKTEQEAVNLIRLYWNNTVLSKSYRNRVIKQWTEISANPQYLQFRNLISTNLMKIFNS